MPSPGRPALSSGGGGGLAGAHCGWLVQHTPLTYPCSLTCCCFLPPPGSVPQPPGKALTGRSVGPSSALPGDPYNSAAGPADFEIGPSAPSASGEGTSVRDPPSLSHPETEVSLSALPGPGRQEEEWGALRGVHA